MEKSKIENFEPNFTSINRNKIFSFDNPFKKLFTKEKTEGKEP